MLVLGLGSSTDPLILYPVCVTEPTQPPPNDNPTPIQFCIQTTPALRAVHTSASRVSCASSTAEECSLDISVALTECDILFVLFDSTQINIEDQVFGEQLTSLGKKTKFAISHETICNRIADFYDRKESLRAMLVR